MSCLTLINEGADTDRICESQGEPEARGHPEAEGRGWQGEGHGHPSTPSGKGQRGSTGLEPPAPGSGTRQVPQGWGAGRGSRTRELQPPCWGHLPTPACSHPLKLAHPRGGGLAPNGASKGILSPCPHSEASHCHPEGPKVPCQARKGLVFLSRPTQSHPVLFYRLSTYYLCLVTGTNMWGCPFGCDGILSPPLRTNHQD